MALELFFVIVILLIVAIIFLIVGFYIGKLLRDKYWENLVPEIREDARKRSREVLGGQFAEQLAPYLPDFPFSPTEARFIGKPIDFLIFKGMDQKNIQEVVFVEVKSGNSVLSGQEKFLKEAIDNKRVKWHTYNVARDITRKTV